MTHPIPPPPPGHRRCAGDPACPFHIPTWHPAQLCPAHAEPTAITYSGIPALMRARPGR
jgi:hypothetical protein